MIDLAPGQKHSFLAKSPILLACGVAGYGDAPPVGVRLDALGGIVVGPFGAPERGRSGNHRLAEMAGGMVLRAGGPRRHAARSVQRYGRDWRQLGCPVIAQIADEQAQDAARSAAQLALGSPAALEVLMPGAVQGGGRFLVRSLVEAGETPVWAKLPFDGVERAAERAVEEGASTLVIGRAPSAALPRTREGESFTVRGELHGPTLYPLMLDALLRVAALRLPCALIACGGIHTVAQARAALDAGAHAIQLDSVVWIEPGLVNELAAALEHG